MKINPLAQKTTYDTDNMASGCVIFHGAGNTFSEVKNMMRTFLIGAAGYPLLELIYRQRTHYSMAIAGGLSLLLIRHTAKRRCSWVVRILLCGAGITAIEYLCGMLWNRNYKVWDYRNQPMNLRGQICLRFTSIWCLLSAVALCAYSFIDRRKRPD